MPAFILIPSFETHHSVPSLELRGAGEAGNCIQLERIENRAELNIEFGSLSAILKPHPQQIIRLVLDIGTVKQPEGRPVAIFGFGLLPAAGLEGDARQACRVFARGR